MIFIITYVYIVPEIYITLARVNAKCPLESFYIKIRFCNNVKQRKRKHLDIF